MKGLAAVAVAGAVAYVGIDVALRFLHPSLSLLHNAESDYGNGPYSWLMDANFVLRGVLSFAAAGALWLGLPRRGLARAGAGLVAAWALCSTVLAFFQDDLRGAPVTAHGVVHLTAAFLGFTACLVGTLLLTIDVRARPGDRAAVPVLWVVWVIAALGLLALGRAGFHPASLGGLFERVFIGAEILWLALAALLVARRHGQ
ncbi:MAG TPA: DUF998 domain-containing protein [Actinomycetota bacterium]|nr:DUF998 domain-containing protein [Actinomycetota bacterium]